jgi:L-alanine-DL-glutamate epimerase-like enolase superfamily enzyme
MKITKLVPWLVKAAGTYWGEYFFVEVRTDEGVTGWGEITTTTKIANRAVAGIIRQLNDLLVGEDPSQIERLWHKTFRSFTYTGSRGATTNVVSGIDIAMWDILGKVTGQPVGRLLGGRYRDRVLAYASLLMREPRALAERLAAVRAQGFRAFKIGWGPFGRTSSSTSSSKDDEAIVRAAREAVSADSLLMVDAGASDAFWPQDYKWAARTARMLADYGVYWFEEPLPPDNLHDYVLLRGHSPVPIAGGEVLTRRQSFTPWLQQRAFDIVQPDVTKVGGISEERRIAWMAEENGVRFIPHGWNTALGLAADLHLASAMPNTGLVEYLTGSPFIDDLVETRWKLDADGMLPVPNGPGLGIALNADAVEKHTGERFP